MDQVAAAELDHIRQESRHALEQSWARAEQLQAESNEITQRLQDLEDTLARLKMATSNESYVSNESSLRKSSDMDDDDDEYTNDDTNDDTNDSSWQSAASDDKRMLFKRKHPDIGSNQSSAGSHSFENDGSARTLESLGWLSQQSGRISGRMQRRGSSGMILEDSFSQLPGSTSNRMQRRGSVGMVIDGYSSNRTRNNVLSSPLPGLERMMRRGSCSGRVEAGMLILHPPTGSITTGAELPQEDSEESRRVQLMIHERDEKVQELTQGLEEKEEELQQLQHETSLQQSTIQKLNAELEALEAPHRLVSLQREVDGMRDMIQELEEELEDEQNEMSEAQQTHLALEAEWHDLEDLVADSEVNSESNLVYLNTKLQKYRQESDAKEMRRNFFLLSSQESLESMRQDLMDHLAVPACTRLIKTLQDQREVLIQKEQDLSSLLMTRLDERASLSNSIKAIEKLNTLFLKLLKKVEKKKEKLDRIEDLGHFSEDLDATTAFNQLEYLIQQLDDNVIAIQDELSARAKAIEEGVTIQTSESPGKVAKLALDGEKLAFSIVAKMRQAEQSLPDAVSKAGMIRITENDKLIKQLEEKVHNQEKNLESFETELGSLACAISTDLENEGSSHREMEEELKFMQYGIKEKDRIIETIEAIISDREKSELSLMGEIEDLRDHGEISERIAMQALDRGQE